MPASGGWFIYAMGSGWGHLNRALALARVAVQHRLQYRPIHLLTNSPYIEILRPKLALPSLTIHSLHHIDSLVVAREKVQALLTSVEYGTLVVDTFPRGLIGELAEVIPSQTDICHVLIHRDLSPDYIESKAIEPFVRNHYDGLLLPGEPTVALAHLPQAKLTEPWLSRNETELPDANEMRSRWNIPSHAPLIIVCATGQPTELAFFGQVFKQLAISFPNATVRCLSAECPTGCEPSHWVSHWPGIDILQLADVVIGSGGYNLVHECSALGIPLIAFVQKRRYDRQARRIRDYAHGVNCVEDAIAMIPAFLQSKKTIANNKPCYRNGVSTAINFIEDWRSHRP